MLIQYINMLIIYVNDICIIMNYTYNDKYINNIYIYIVYMRIIK